MTRSSNRAAFIAVAGLVVALPWGWAVGEQPTSPEAGHATPPGPQAMQRMPCGKRTDVVRMLRENSGEGPIAHGLANTGAVAEVFISAEGTWTIVATSPNGLSCMIGTGQAWQPTIARDDTI